MVMDWLLPGLFLLPGFSVLTGVLAIARMYRSWHRISPWMKKLRKSWGCRVVPWPREYMPDVFPSRLGSEACIVDVDNRRLIVVWLDAVGLLEDRGDVWVVSDKNGRVRVASSARREVEVWREELLYLWGVEGTAFFLAPEGFVWPNRKPYRGVVGMERIDDAFGLAKKLVEHLPRGPWPPFQDFQQNGWAHWGTCAMAWFSILWRAILGMCLVVSGLAMSLAGGEWVRALKWGLQ